MTMNIGKVKVALVFTILFATITFGQISIEAGMTSDCWCVSDQSMISQTYTDHDAISIDGNVDFLSQATAESWVGTGLAGSPIIVEGYRITDSITEGIKILNVNLHWIVRDCLIEGGGPSYACGFYIDNCSNGEFSNNIIDSRDVGIQIYEGTHNSSFIDNQIIGNQDTAFKVIGGMRNCIISGNTFQDNLGNNFWITGGFNDSVISGNTIKGGNNGIRVTACLQSNVVRNTISDCGLDALVFPSAIGLVISENSVVNTTGCGIMTSGDTIQISSNTVIDSTGAGIYIASGDDGLVTRNSVTNSSDYGLKLGGSTTNVTITENSFIDNTGGTSQVLDDGVENIISYNHYSDWTSPDNDANGIVDVAYDLDGESTNSDLYPIVDVAGIVPITSTETSLNIFPYLAIGGMVLLLAAAALFRKRR